MRWTTISGPCRAIPALAALLAVAPLGAQQQPTFPSGVELVKVDVVVVDGDGRPVRGLGRGDFRVFDEGRERPVVTLEAVTPAPTSTAGEIRTRPARVSTNVGARAPAPRSLFLFVFEGLRPSSRGTYRAARVLRAFFDANEGLEADVALGSTHRDETWTGTVRDLRAPAAFERALAAVLGPPGAGGAYLDPRGLDAGVVPGVPDWAASRMNALSEEARLTRLNELMDHLAAGRPGRTTMIVLGEGVVAEPFAGRSPMRTREVVDRAARHRVVIDGLDLRGLTAPGLGVDGARLPGTADGTESGFAMDGSASWAEELAVAAGGRNVRNVANLDAALASFVEEGQSYYLLGFEPDAGARPGRTRSIRVQLVQKGFEVRARPAYYVPRPGERPAAEAPAGPLLPLRVAAYVGGETGEGRSRVRIVIEVDPASLAAPGATGRVTLESQIDAAPLAGGKGQRVENRSDARLTPALRQALADAWVPLARDLDLGPGRYEGRIVLRDVASGRSGTVTHPFEVPAPGSPRLTTPVVTDMFRADGSAVEIARGRFDPGRTVECRFEAVGFGPGAGAPPRLEGRWTLRSEAGAPVGGGTVEATGEGRAHFAFPVPLAGLADGPYTLSLAVRDPATGASAADEERVEVARGAGPR